MLDQISFDSKTIRQQQLKSKMNYIISSRIREEDYWAERHRFNLKAMPNIEYNIIRKKRKVCDEVINYNPQTNCYGYKFFGARVYGTKMSRMDRLGY